MSDDYTFPEAAIEALVCPFCRAEPGQPCRTVPLNLPTGTHAARWQPLAIAWSDGYQEAESGIKALRPTADTEGSDR